MKTAIKHFQTLFMCEQFVVTGSTALHYMGLVDNPSDLDIILVNPTEETKELCQRLQDNSPAKTKPGGNGEVNYIFEYGNMKVDIFILKKKVETELLVDGFSITKLPTIIAAKKRFSRIKDWLQLRNLSRLFFKEEEFNGFLNERAYTFDSEYTNQ